MSLEKEKARAALAVALQALAEEVSRYADIYLPNRTPSSAFLKMFEEMGELVADPKDPSEWADVFIMLLDLAHMHRVTPMLVTEIFEKLEINAKSEFTPLQNSVVSKRTKIQAEGLLYCFNGGPENGRCVRGSKNAIEAAFRPRPRPGNGRYELTAPGQFQWVEGREGEHED